MGSTLTNGIYLPAEGERNCYTGLAANWSALDSLIGGYNAHIGNTTIHVTAEDKEAWNGKADASALTAHTGDTTIHVTAEDKEAWNGKADASALTAHTGNTTIHVTAEDKAKWDAVTSKADDSDVVHKSGNETIGGKKTFSDDLTIYNNDSSQSTKTLIISSSKIQVGDTSNSDSFGINFNAGLSYIASVSAAKDTSGTQSLRFSVRTKDNSNNFITSRVRLRLFANGNSFFEPETDNAVSLGSSSYKFKDVQTNLVNGLTPSSLSLPNYQAGKVDISAYITDLTGGNNNYTAPANGYVFVRTPNGTYLKLLEYPSGVGSTVCSQTADDIGTFIPVLAGRICIIAIKCSSIDRAYFIPCLGNV